MNKIILKSETYPRNITINKENYTKIRPNTTPRLLTVYFARKTGRSIPIERDIAYFIVNHFDSVCVLNEAGKETDIKDDLESLGITELRKLVAKWNKRVKELGMTGINTLGIGKKDAIQQIREWRTLGVEA